jgi:hypothetical protein
MDEPLAYFLTWTTYGSWLPGDDRGWFAKPGEFRAADADAKLVAERRLTEPPVTLDVGQRRIVEDTIAAHCRIRGWQLLAVAARTQHVHVVVTAPGRHPDEVMDQLKAWCTRKLKEHVRRSVGDGGRQNWWTQRGSKRWLNDTESLESAVRYVLEGQGEPTPRPSSQA